MGRRSSNRASRPRRLSSEIGRIGKFFVTPTKHEKELKRRAIARQRAVEKAIMARNKAIKKQELLEAKAERKRRARIAKAVAKIRKRTRIEGI